MASHSPQPLTIDSALAKLPGVGPAVAQRLQRLGITHLNNLFEHFPRRYEDWHTIRPIHSLRIGEAGVVIQARIRQFSEERSPRRHLHLTHLELEDDSGTIVATWFNQPYLQRVFQIGETKLFRGTVGFDRTNHHKQLINPTYENQPILRPIYPETAGLSSKQLRNLLQKAWPALASLPDRFPKEISEEYHLPDRSVALKMIHHPASLADTTAGQHRFAFEELFWFAVRYEQTRELLAHHQAPAIAIDPAILKDFTSHLSFTLTDDQRRASWQIIKDLRRNHPMNRLLNGDVGTGKTVVATLATLAASLAGYQTIWLAPTEILARQHFATITKLLKPFVVKVDLLTGSHRPQDSIFKTPNSVIVGTHALFHQHHHFERLGLVVVDEQHRFGVDQRSLLREVRLVDGQHLIPHFLSLSATPIPRTLALALYGELDLSVLKETPTGRKVIKTRVVNPDQRAAAYQFIRGQITAGRQVYVVCPIIEESESAAETLFAAREAKGAVAVAEHLQTKIFPEFRVGLLHGRLKSKEKDAVMAAFTAHQLDILVATAVIEVGIDVPNASVMLIEGADRFGLAQLHQLRGRVGRGPHQSFCFLLTDDSSTIVTDRLQTVEQTFDGFALAEADLKQRGPGEFLGTGQSGFPAFKLASVIDYDLMKQAQTAAKQALSAGLINQTEFVDAVHYLE